MSRFCRPISSKVSDVALFEQTFELLTGDQVARARVVNENLANLCPILHGLSLILI